MLETTDSFHDKFENGEPVASRQPGFRRKLVKQLFDSQSPFDFATWKSP